MPAAWQPAVTKPQTGCGYSEVRALNFSRCAQDGRPVMQAASQSVCLLRVTDKRLRAAPRLTSESCADQVMALSVPAWQRMLPAGTLLYDAT